MPLLIRKIPGTEYYDAISVWGYVGPIYNNIKDHFDNTDFINQLNDYLRLNKIVSVFSWLNSFLKNQNNILKNAGLIKELHQIVNIYITKSTEEQRAILSKTLKHYINKYKKLFDFRV